MVTINTDASFYHEDGRAGYAFWISSDVGRFKKWGKLNTDCKKDPTYAEFFCIANAIHYTMLHPELKGKITKLHINTDSQKCINFFNSPSKCYTSRKHKPMRKAYRYIKKLTKNVDIKWQHVYSHTNNDDKRSFVNNWCDQMAKQGANL